MSKYVLTALGAGVVFGALLLSACRQPNQPAPAAPEGTPGTPQPAAFSGTQQPAAGRPAAHEHAAHEHGPAGHEHGTATPSEYAEALSKLAPDDRQTAAQQKTCPVSGQALGAMGTPVKVNVAGRAVFLCCPGCEQELLSDPQKYLAKLDQDH